MTVCEAESIGSSTVGDERDHFSRTHTFGWGNAHLYIDWRYKGEAHALIHLTHGNIMVPDEHTRNMEARVVWQY